MTIDKDVSNMLESLGLPVKPCGLNADWCVSAWHLSHGTPNITNGDRYLLDTENINDNNEPLFELVQRFYTDDDENDIQVIWRNMTLSQIEENLKTVIAENIEIG